MGYAYTPGLTVAPHTVVRKVRRLPLAGRILVEPGQRVSADTIVAETSLPGELRPLNATGALGIGPEELPAAMVKREGETVAAEEVIARRSTFFGLLKSELRSPLAGTIESISKLTGQVIVRGQPIALQRRAFAAGRIVDISASESVTVEVVGTYIQGIFGIGGEIAGPLHVVCNRPDETLDADRISPALRGTVLLGGGRVTAAAVRKVIECGVHGLIVGGLDDADLRGFLGYEIGVAITGEETLGVTIVVTEGFGEIAMAAATHALLTRRAGLLTSINGATQIRAGVIRPEILIPWEEAPSAENPTASTGGAPDTAMPGDTCDNPPAAAVMPTILAGIHPASEAASILQVGTRVRAIRAPHFGRLGRCTALPAELRTIESEAQVRVLTVTFDDGTEATVPRANVELIKG